MNNTQDQSKLNQLKTFRYDMLNALSRKDDALSEQKKWELKAKRAEKEYQALKARYDKLNDEA